MENKEAVIILKGIQYDIMPHDELSGQRTEDVAFSLAIKALEAQGWIPVTERLPEINVDVIVTDIETTETYSSYYLGDGFWECDNGTHKKRIIAWMPFPKPYTKEKTT